MPAWLSSLLQSIKWVANIADTVGAFLNWMNPVAPLASGLKKGLSWAEPRLIGFILSIATTSSTAGTVAAPKILDAAYWDNQIAAVDTYDYAQAHDVCVHDYASDPGICQ